MLIILKTSCQLVEVPDNWKRAADEKTGYVNEERVVNIIYVVSGNIFHTITHSILIFKLRKYGVHECPGFGWDRGNCLPGSWYSVMSWIQYEKNVDNTVMFSVVAK